MGFFFLFQVNGTEIEYEFEEITLERVSQSGGLLTDSVKVVCLNTLTT